MPNALRADEIQAHSFLDELSRNAAHFFPKLGASLLVFIAFWITAAIVGQLIARVADRFADGKRIAVLLLGQIAKVAIISFGAVTALGTLGINVSALVAGLGLTGFALGFALKDALSNMLCGFLILIYHPFRVGDEISVTGLDGRVVNIDLRYTTLEADGKALLIPNSNLFTNPIIVQKERTPAVSSRS